MIYTDNLEPDNLPGAPRLDTTLQSEIETQGQLKDNAAQKERTKSISLLFLLLLPLSLGAYLYFTNPFRDDLIKVVYSLSDLKPSQQYNIELAARSLDGKILKPGELFSFNRTVGPRRDSRGYRPATTYIGAESPATVGGGICLLSSALYQAALAVGLKIEARNPHLRTISSVTPGLDATVWYGGLDLKFRNCTNHPIEINAECKNHNVYVSLRGEKAADMPKLAQLKTVIAKRNNRELMVEVFRDVDGKLSFVSRDNYQLNR